VFGEQFQHRLSDAKLFLVGFLLISHLSCASLSTLSDFVYISSHDASLRILTYVTFIFLYPFTVSFISHYFMYKTFVAYSRAVVT